MVPYSKVLLLLLLLFFFYSFIFDSLEQKIACISRLALYVALGFSVFEI